ncbi:MAG TPA: endospore germination permease [Ureibacillus sp.]|nr:endospore germination permease [Ureibacillus sp.]
MREPRQITATQTMMTITNSMVGVSVLALPRIASEQVNSGAVLITILGLFLAFVGMMIIAALGIRFPNDSLIQSSKAIIGRPLSYLFGFFIFLFFIIIVGLITREFSFILSSFLFPDTPATVLIGTMLIVVAITTRNDITTISYIQFVYFPFIAFPILLLVFLAFPEMDIRQLRPFVGNQTTFQDFIEGSLIIAALPFVHIGSFILSIYIPHTQSTKHAIRGSIFGAILSGTLLSLIVLVTVGVFGMNDVRNPLWPVYVLTRMIQLPFELLERLDILFLIIWILSAFTTILSGYLIVIYNGSQLFNLKSHRVLSYLMLPIVFIMALYPQDILQLYDLLRTVGLYGLLITMLYPLLLLLVAFIRKKRGAVNEA